MFQSQPEDVVEELTEVIVAEGQARAEIDRRSGAPGGHGMPGPPQVVDTGESAVDIARRNGLLVSATEYERAMATQN